MAVKTFDQISQSIIDNILTVNPAVDIKIGEMVRDLFIDVQASQLEALYNIAEYSSRAQSVLTARGNQLDRIGYNFNIPRNLATRSVGTLTLIIKNGLTAPTLLNIGDQFYTSIDQNGAIYTFICAQTTLLTEGTVEATIPIIALTPGSASNVAALSITQSNYEFVDSVSNTQPTSGGTDVESDTAYAARIPVYATGLYTNVFNGINKILFGVQNISEFSSMVTPGNPLARGPYQVDVYLQRVPTYFGTTVTETAPANQQQYVFKQQPVYELNPVNQITQYNPATNTTTTYDPSTYSVVANPADTIMQTTGSTQASTMIQWVGTPPALPYTVSYNVDQTIIDAQNAFAATNEVVSDVLFRQAHAVPLYISANVQGRISASELSINQSVGTNLDNMFGMLGINQALTPNNAVYAALQDPTIAQFYLTNFDSTFQITLTGTYAASAWNFAVTGPHTTALSNHPITPLGIYWDNDVTPSAFAQGIPTAGRLYIGDPKYIPFSSPGTPNLPSSSINGVQSATMISNVQGSWAEFLNIDSFYDQRTQTLALTFSPAPTFNTDGSNPTITFNIIQPYISISNALTYLTLGPSLVQPIIEYPVVTTPQYYGTILPAELPIGLAQVYQNGQALLQSTDGVIGDYAFMIPSGTGGSLIVSPTPIADSNGVYTIQFLTTVQSTDVLQFGLLNPNLKISITSS